MAVRIRSQKFIRFGAFEVDLRAGELRRQGLKIKLQEQPLQILAMLLERPSEVVTREELQQRLCPADTFVGFDHSLNTAIKRLRAGQQLRINAQLIRARDDFPVWSGRFDRELTDVFAIQDEISRGIVNILRLKLGRGRRRYETSVETYDLYLRARAPPIQRGVAGNTQSIGPFEEAIARDPSFAPAYAGLAAAHAFRSGTADFDREDELAKMRGAAEKADPLSPAVHNSLAYALLSAGRIR